MMKLQFLALFLSLTLYTRSSLSAKVAMLPNFGRSHYIVLAKLGAELERRGHEVVILVGVEATYAVGKPNVKAFEMDDKLKTNLDDQAKHMSSVSKGALGIFRQFSGLFGLQKEYCDLLFGSAEMMNELKTADVLIGDSLYLCSALVADHFSLPHVVVIMGPLATPILQAYGFQMFPAYVPQLTSGVPVKMGILDRVKNFGYYVSNLVLYNFLVTSVFGDVKEKYKIRPEKTIQETLATIDMILLARDLVLDHAQPIMPYIREVGNFLPSPIQPLPADLEEFMQSSGDEGVILVSFGSMLDTLDDDVTTMMIEAFSRVPQKILWKLKHGKSSLGPNIKTVKWLPQNDVLGHEKTKLFITHGGANGMAEAAYHGVPMVCSPFFGDQHDNGQFIKYAGIGEMVDVNTATADQLASVLKIVLKDNRYQETSARVSKVIRIRPRTPVQEAADLVEYVQAQGHLDHLKPRGLTLPFYQVYMLDVMAVLGLAVVIVLVVLVSLVKLVFRACCKSSKKAKTS